MAFLDRYCKTDYDSYETFFRDFKVEMPEGFNYGYDVVDQLAKEQPGKTAIVWCNDAGEENIITFAQLKQNSDKMANALRELGIKKGDVVMAMLKRRFEYWYFTIAMHKLGAILIPATHLLTVKDLVYRIEAADVRMVLTLDDEELCRQIDEAQQKTGKRLQIKALLNGARDGYVDFGPLWQNAPEAFARPEGDAAPKSTDVMIAYFTSGTEGMPKIVAHDYYYPLCHITTAKFWHDLDETDLHLTVADTGWAKTSWGKIYGQWLCEAAVFVYDYDKRFSPSDFLRLIDKYGITSFCAPPTIYRYLIKEDLSRFSLASLKKASIAGEPLNPEIYYQWLKATGLKLKEGYGQTECTVLVANNRWMEPKPGSMGLPMPGSNCVILDTNGNEVEVGEEGELCVPVPDMRQRPLGLFMGYYNDDERTRTVLYNGVYHTGDTAWKDEDGYYWFKGRNDDIIKSSGYRIGPFEVESALLEHPAVLEAAITGVPDPDRGLNVKATIILAKGYAPGDALAKELQDHVKKVTAPYKYPRIIEFVDELPKTISGKIRRVQIRSGDGGAKPAISGEMLQISARIRELRELAEFEPGFVAKELGVSTDTYLRYETSGENIPISTLYHMANLYGVEMSEILTGRTPRIDTFSVVAEGQGVQVDRYPGYNFQGLAYKFKHKIMEPMLVTVDPSDGDPELVTHEGQEFNYVLEGGIWLIYDDKRVVLRKGDCVYFDPTHPHGQKAMDGRPARFLTIITE